MAVTNETTTTCFRWSCGCRAKGLWAYHRETAESNAMWHNMTCNMTITIEELNF
jgi:hypothetical protein